MHTLKFTRVIVIAVAVVLICAAGVGAWFYWYAVTPVGGSDRTVTVWIKPGQGFFETMDQLQDLGLIRHRERFRWLAFLRGLERRVQAGEYALSASMSPQQILETLAHGQTVVHKVVVAEGATLVRIGELLEHAGLMSKQAFMRAATNPDVAAALGLQGPTLEGYLFPETYHFSKGIPPGGVINKMVAQFRSVFSPAWAERARAMGLSMHQVVTLASIVEKETADPRERPLIAAVFLNRLKRNMRLESDPTVIYGLQSFDGNLTEKDLRTPTPYNTYRIKGLPPGPICNPGKGAIEAVLFPADESYLYFVSKNDGTHHFSRTLAEHNRMVRRYQLKRY